MPNFRCFQNAVLLGKDSQKTQEFVMRIKCI